ncbi:hypothetical protein CTAYLR_001878 [Chrysophaeum taylorii]|uniref:Uncharacterized protein n=1 Tax=Chrysophaeum taylorii TaxID=2483200 RepID=A0AAD7XG68_9STRA|nr:hypothetical protein CTAYLR_001878 [Chrysophaeum taylorii]
MNDEDNDDDAAYVGVVDLSMRGWRSLDDVRIDPRTRSLRLEHNNLVRLPGDMFRLELLAHLDVSHNTLESLPAELGTCTRLRVLNCAFNNLTWLPPELGDCLFLEEVIANHNRLTTVPAALGSLQVLRVIVLHHNRLESLPTDIGSLDTLDVLDCSHNDKLDMIPDSLRDDADMVTFTMRLHYHIGRHTREIKDEYAAMQAALMEKEEHNLRLREAIDIVNKDKAKIRASRVPWASCRLC